jgi:hypothetical protein
MAKINVPLQLIHSHDYTKMYYMNAEQQSQRPVVLSMLKPMSSSTAHPRNSAFSALSLLRAFLFLAFVISTIGWAGHAEAIQNPSVILWQASPQTFVVSLYQGVLGRNPESQTVVDTWARQVSDPNSRKRIFWHFVNSPEYQARFKPPGAAWRTWSIWFKSGNPPAYRGQYVAAERHPGDGYWSAVDGSHYQLVARALLGWYLAYGRRN